MPREKVMALNAHCTLGMGIQRSAQARIAEFKSQLDANYRWLDEVLVVAKKTFARADAELLPKTPSSKRMRTVLNKRRSRLPAPIAEEEESEDDYVPSKKKTRKMPVRASKRTRKTTRQQKSNNLSTSTTADSIIIESTASSDTEEGQKFKSPVVVCDVVDASPMSGGGDTLSCPKLTHRTTVSLGHRCSNEVVQDVSGQTQTQPAAPSPHLMRGFALLTVKDKVNVIEGKIDAVAVAADPPYSVSSKSPRTPVSSEQTHMHSKRRSKAGQKRRSSRVSRRGSARVSISKARRSSVYRNKPCGHRMAAPGRAVQEAATTEVKVRPVMSPRKAASSVLATLRTPETNRCTRSKMRTQDRLRAVLSPSGASTNSGSASSYSPVKPVRTGQPKMATTTSSSDDTEKDRANSEGRDNTPATCSASDTEELLKPVRTTRAAARQKIDETESAKRPGSAEQRQGRSLSPYKRQCTATRDEHTPTEAVQGESVIADTPSPVMTAKTAMSAVHRLNRLRITPNHNTSTLNSFIRRNTPLQSRLDTVELKRQELATKEQQNSTRLQRRNEQMQKRAEEQRKRREEKQLLAAQRRQERERTMREMRLDMIQRSVEKSIRPNQSYAMRLREERSKLRQRKVAEAEQRRKQEEEMRQQKFATKEEEQRKHEELKRRQRDYEEQERQRRIADTERQRKQRQQELEQQERCRIAERQRQIEAERQREERERERLEKERLQQQREREERRQEELRALREQERQQTEARREAERRAEEEERRLRQVIDKHNSSLQAKSAAPNTNTNTSVNTSTMQAKSHVLNTSYTVPTPQHSAPPTSADTSSYDMTPPVKKYTPSTSENYNIDNISSEDSTDDEGAPKKKIPAWACGGQLKAALINQHHHSVDLDTIFTPIEPPDLNILFPNKRKPRFNKRTSSAVWHSPMYTAGGQPDS